MVLTLNGASACAPPLVFFCLEVNGTHFVIKLLLVLIYDLD